ncbi:MAG TPA: hypothetical protein VFP72_24295, partial [Kineosporiaceae bacterium]|nr:hypothetical protein [Kineosporiaceae bacterium]
RAAGRGAHPAPSGTGKHHRPGAAAGHGPEEHGALPPLLGLRHAWVPVEGRVEDVMLAAVRALAASNRPRPPAAGSHSSRNILQRSTSC